MISFIYFDVDGVLIQAPGLKNPPIPENLDYQPNLPIWAVIKKLESVCRLGLLTNLSSRLLAELNQNRLLPDVTWDVVIDSAAGPFIKPDVALYQLAQEKAGVPASQILFIDNHQRNLEPAAVLGWSVFFYDSARPVAASRRLIAHLDSIQLSHAKAESQDA